MAKEQKEQQKQKICAIVRPCGGVIEFIDMNRKIEDVLNSPSVDVRASCQMAVFDPAVVLRPKEDVNSLSPNDKDFGMQCIIEMVPKECNECIGDCLNIGKYNKGLMDEIYPFFLSSNERSVREISFGDEMFNNGFSPVIKREN